MSDDLSGFSLMELFRLEAEGQTAVLSSGLLSHRDRRPARAAPETIEPMMRAAHLAQGGRPDRRRRCRGPGRTRDGRRLRRGPEGDGSTSSARPSVDVLLRRASICSRRSRSSATTSSRPGRPSATNPPSPISSLLCTHCSQPPTPPGPTNVEPPAPPDPHGGSDRLEVETPPPASSTAGSSAATNGRRGGPRGD